VYMLAHDPTPPSIARTGRRQRLAREEAAQ
jgi:hypothetical protein